jgi:ribosome-binding protein aMBF1 (putative translation factor)
MTKYENSNPEPRCEKCGEKVKELFEIVSSSKSLWVCEKCKNVFPRKPEPRGVILDRSKKGESFF